MRSIKEKSLFYAGSYFRKRTEARLYGESLRSSKPPTIARLQHCESSN